jgi:uncharacterized protein YceK
MSGLTSGCAHDSSIVSREAIVDGHGDEDVSVVIAEATNSTWTMSPGSPQRR